MFLFWKELGKIFVVPVLMCIAGLVVSRYVNFYRLATLSAGIVLYTVVYIVLTWLLAMNDYERRIIKEFAWKLLRKKH